MWGNFAAILRVFSRVTVLSIFILILAIQNMSMIKTVHAFSGDACSCGCEDDGGACDTTCCATESFSQCECSEPHQDVVIFIMPGSLDNFLQTTESLGNMYLPMAYFHEYKNGFYESLLIEPPAPVPIA